MCVDSSVVFAVLHRDHSEEKERREREELARREEEERVRREKEEARRKEEERLEAERLAKLEAEVNSVPWRLVDVMTPATNSASEPRRRRKSERDCCKLKRSSRSHLCDGR